MRKLTFLFVVALLCCAGSHAATITVPGGQPTIQAAVLAANSGDVIQIAAGTYNEDVFIPGSSLFSKNNLTLEPAPGANVVIDCPNTRGANPAADGLYGAIMIAFGAPPGTIDYHGFIIEGDGITLRNLTIRNMTADVDFVVQEAATVLLMGDNCTIENCVLEANPANDSMRALYIFTGNYALVNPAFSAAGYGDPVTAANLNMTGCTLRNGTTFDTVDAALYILAYYYATFIPEVHPSGTVTDCELVGAYGVGGFGEYDAGDFTFNNCHFHDANDAADIGGGVWEFNQCLFERSSHNNLVAVEANPAESGPGLADVTFNGCVFCGGADDGRLVRVSEGNVAFSGCIFNVTDTVDAGIQYSPGDFDEEWGYAIPGGYPPSTNVTVDHCDFISPAGRGIYGDDPQDIPGEPIGNLTVTNSIFQCDEPILLVGAAGVSARNAAVNNNNLHVGGVVANPDGGWVVTESANLNEVPGYIDPTQCPDPENPDVYNYQNQDLRGAGIGGSDLGSQGPTDPPAGISDWNLYE
jgi:hypothetical protein